MIIVIDDSSITSLQHLTGTAKDSARSFLNFLQSAKSLNEINLVFDDVELRDNENLVYFIKVNEQHVTACIPKLPQDTVSELSQRFQYKAHERRNVGYLSNSCNTVMEAL